MKRENGTADDASDRPRFVAVPVLVRWAPGLLARIDPGGRRIVPRAAAGVRIGEHIRF